MGVTPRRLERICWGWGQGCQGCLVLSSFQQMGLNGASCFHYLVTKGKQPQPCLLRVLCQESPVPGESRARRVPAHPLPQLLLQQQADDGVGHAEPHGRSHDEDLLEPGWESTLWGEEGVRPTLLCQGTYPSRGDSQQRDPTMAMPNLKRASQAHSLYEVIRKQITSLELGRQRVWLRGGEVKTGNRDYAKNTPRLVFTLIAFFSGKGRRHQMPAR